MQTESVLSPRLSLPKEILFVLSATLFLALASQISIPMQPVPLTFQSVTVLLIGMALGPRLGAYSILTYLGAGALGLPVFAELSGGLHVFFGPTGGYLLGFLPAAILSGYLAQKGFKKTGALVGALLIFMFGFSVLSLYVGAENAWTFGVKPFLISEPLKLVVLCLFLKK